MPVGNWNHITCFGALLDKSCIRMDLIDFISYTQIEYLSIHMRIVSHEKYGNTLGNKVSERVHFAISCHSKTARFSS